MVDAREIFRVLEEYFPLTLAEEWDNVGLQLGSMNCKVSRVLVALDLDGDVVTAARDGQAELIIIHHPLFFHDIKCINLDTPQGRIIQELLQAGITVYSAHTNLDAASAGLNQYLAEKLGLQKVRPWQQGQVEELYKLVVYVPESHLEVVRSALTSGGAGFIGNYSDCTFRVAGTGTFKPLVGTDPFIGEIGQVEEVAEYRLETVVPAGQLRAVMKAMLAAHPYEEVAYDLYRLSNRGRVFSPGRIGLLPHPARLGEVAREVKQRLNLEYVLVVGNEDEVVEKIAVVSGSGASFISQARQEGAQALITGDIKYHEAREAEAMGFNIIDAGHYGTEKGVTELLKKVLDQEAVAHGWNLEVLISDGSSPFKRA